MNNFQNIPISRIKVDGDRRKVDAGKVAEIAESIEQVGLINPITVLKDRKKYRLLSGQHRLAAFRELLGRKTIPCYVLSRLDDLDAALVEIDENLVRNDLNVLEQGEHLIKRDFILDLKGQLAKQGGSGSNQYQKKSKLGMITTLQSTADEMKISKSAVQQRKFIAKNLNPDVRDEVRNTPLANATTELLRLARMDGKEQKEVAGKIASKKARNVHDATRLLLREKNRTVPRNLPSASDRYTLYHGDMLEIAEKEIPENSIHAIVTDLPYEKKYLRLYERLAIVADRVLKPGHSLLVMCGQSYLPEILQLMTPILTYQWIIAIQFTGLPYRVLRRKVMNYWRCLLWFSKGEFKGYWKQKKNTSGNWIHDSFSCARMLKERDMWEQGVDMFVDGISAFTQENDTVLDVAVGTCSTGIAALSLKRKFILIDKSKQMIDISRKRLNEYCSD